MLPSPRDGSKENTLDADPPIRVGKGQKFILDGQTFDLDAVHSIASDPRHVATSPFTSYNDHGKGCFASMVDVAVLGATEVDLAFNANVVTHSDGRLLHGIGGW
jgi:citrate lyase subunit alpha/citrate CoA-transferase